MSGLYCLSNNTEVITFGSKLLKQQVLGLFFNVLLIGVKANKANNESVLSLNLTQNRNMEINTKDQGVIILKMPSFG